MTVPMQSLEQEVMAAHDAYHEAWNDAIRTGSDGTKAAGFLSKELRSWFANTDMEAPSTGDWADYAESIKQAVGYLTPDAYWTTDQVSVDLRSAAEAVVAYRIRLHRKGKVDPMFTLSVWRKEEDGQWRLCRLYEEVGQSGEPDDSDVRTAHAGMSEAWLQALQTGDGSPCATYLDADLQWLYTGGASDSPTEHRGGDHYAEGLNGAAKQAKGIGWREKMLVTAMRSATEGMVLVHGTAVTKDGEHSVFNLEVWRKRDADWRLVRLYQES